MTYRPAFFETFVALIVALVWARWLASKGWTLPGRLALGVAGLLATSQIVAVALIASEVPGIMADWRMVAASWVPFGAALSVLALEAGLSLYGPPKGAQGP